MAHVQAVSCSTEAWCSRSHGELKRFSECSTNHRAQSAQLCTASFQRVQSPAQQVNLQSAFSISVKQPLRSARSPRTGASKGVVTMGIRAVENFDASFELLPEAQATLVSMLESENFCSQVAQQPGVPPNGKCSFTGNLFMPVPWSPNTKHGMPQEFEKYLEDKDKYVIINVPPTFMFKAKIFKPSRLCAIFKRDPIEQ